MTKTICPAKCGKMFVNEEYAHKHADEAHPDWRIPKAKGWCTPYGFVDFSHPVSYEDACNQAKELSAKFVWPEKATVP